MRVRLLGAKRNCSRLMRRQVIFLNTRDAQSNQANVVGSCICISIPPPPIISKIFRFRIHSVIWHLSLPFLSLCIYIGCCVCFTSFVRERLACSFPKAIQVKEKKPKYFQKRLYFVIVWFLFFYQRKGRQSFQLSVKKKNAIAKK